MFGQLSDLYLELCRITLQPTYSPKKRRAILKQELRLRRSLLVNSSALVESMQDEVSLIPKPVRMYREVLASQQRLLDVLTGLRRIREHLPKKAVVNQVFEERRDLISCVCLALQTCEHAFHSRRSLPQYLPSAREALQKLIVAVEKSLDVEYSSRKTELGFALIFAYAEHEALMEMVTEVETLLDLCRRLFGTAAWIDATNLAMLTPRTEKTSWYCADSV